MSSTGKRHRLIVGLDYGTTFSGLAFGDTFNDEARACGKYPGAGDLHDEKTPSQVSYDAAAPRGYYIGHQIKARAPRQRWTKLLLDDEKQFDDDDDDDDAIGNELRMFDSNLNQPMPVDKDACDVVCDYLTVLFEHAMNQLELDLSADVVKNTPISWVLTVPAVWSDRAVSLTLEAATMAGIGQRDSDTISMISEPEAAAICAIRELKSRTGDLKDFKVGENFLICDAGGGTVDLITYAVTDVTPNLRITESVVGSGSKCGSVFVDEEFRKHLRSKIGDERYNQIKERDMVALSDEFEKLKRKYGSNDVEEPTHYLPLRGFEDDPDAGIEDGVFIGRGKVYANHHRLSDDFRELFNNVIDEIIGLVNGQIQKVIAQNSTVKYIILVGGFGQSAYLLKQLRYHDWDGHPPVEIIQPHGAWSAISRGAVLRERHGSLVVERKSRRSYGTRANDVFNPTIHSEEDAFVSTDTGLKMARNQVSWIITKGTATDATTKHSLKCSTTFQKGETVKRRGTTLVACDADIPPTSYNTKGVYDVCFLTADLSSVPEEEFEEHAIGGNTFLVAEFTIEMTKDSADLKFELCYRGKAYGSVKTTYR